ncbi:uncharacterized protein [Musca autumnalis]|uniref:uncharacterized protein n=1 Tax=Musca autumnalis TaxID=221902 RepID=UPI003CFB47BC
MEEEPVYRLLQAIDPSKIKVPISERFSKLTLSSNKKKQQPEIKEPNDEEVELLAQPNPCNITSREKRQSASRNLLEQLSQESDREVVAKNPLLRSESSKEQSDEMNSSHLPQQYETMDPLNVTEDDDDYQEPEQDDAEKELETDEDNESVELPQHLDVAVDELSQKISTIDLLARPISTISISSTCSSSEPLNEVTQLVSTESQRSSMGVEPRLNIIEVPITKVFKKEIVTVEPTTRIEHRETRTSYEMTEDEEEEDGTTSEDKAITISDSSVSGENKESEDPSDMAMSTINTIRGNLAGLSPDKMARMAAFLKDVSMEQRNLQENGCDITLDNFEYEENSKHCELEKITKARIIATADTESVTPDADDDEDYNTKSLKEKQERLKAYLGETEGKDTSIEEEEENVHRLANDETKDNSVMTDLQVSPTQPPCDDKTPQNKARLIANAETQENSVIYSSPDDELKTPKPHDNSSKQPRRLASADTEENTYMTEEIPEPIYKTPIKSYGTRNYALDETEDNTQMNYSTSSNEVDTRGKDDALRLAHNETEVNTEVSTHSPRNMAEDETQANTSLSDTTSSENRNIHKNLAQADTEVNTSVFIPSSPEMKTPQKSFNNSINSCISESPPINKSAPDHSITILETDDEIENSQTQPSTSPQSNDNNKLSTSLHNGEDSSEIYSESETDTDDQMSQIQMSMANINISAKINIQITVTDSTEPSSEDGDYSDKQRRSTMESLPEQPQQSRETDSDDAYSQQREQQEDTPSNGRKKAEATPSNKTIVRQSRKTPVKNGNHLERTPNKEIGGQNKDSPKADSPNNLDDSCMIVEEDEEFVDAAQKLLNKLYGNSWQTPDVIRTLKRTSDSADKTMKNSSVNKKSSPPRKTKEKPQLAVVDKEMSSLRVTDESTLCDFSIFRKNIVKTNLDSTRLVTPKTKSKKAATSSCHTEPRNVDRAKNALKTHNERDNVFKAPQTELRKPPPRTPAMAKLSANQIRSQNERWRQLIDDTDSESEGNNASDDDDADKSDDESWKASDVAEEDSDFELSPVKPKDKSKRNATNKKDKGNSKSTSKKNARMQETSSNGEESGKVSEAASDGELSPTKAKRNVTNKKPPTANKKTTRKHQSSTNEDSDDGKSSESWKQDDDDESNSDSDFEPKTRRNKRNNNNNNNTKTTKTQKNAKHSDDQLVYLDLSKEEVSIMEDVPESPPANHDATFASRLNDILKTCRHEDKPKLPSSAKSTKTKRKLFTPMFGHDLEGDDVALPEIVEKENKKILVEESESIILDNATCPFDAKGRPKKLDIYNKQLESVKAGKPIFKLTPSPKKASAATTPLREKVNETPNSKTKSNNKIKPQTPTTGRKGDPKKLDDLCPTPDYKYSFLKSLDVTVSKAFCHPDALIYRESYGKKKEDLANILYEMYNKQLFGNKLDVPLTWNKKLSNTAGRCLNKKKLGVRSCVIELSEKVLTSADRLRCTLIHELCHAATWIFNGEGGHGRTWKMWAQKANATFPEIPKIGVCHQYDIEYKYTYKCTLCGAKSHAHSKSKKVENIRCSYCHGAIEIFLNKKDKEGNIIPTPVREPTGFAKFVKDNYKKYKRDDAKHADIMKILSNEFATLKLKNGN